MLLVTVDSGTTNTRVSVWRGSELIACTGESVGIRDVAKAQKPDILIHGIKRLLDSALESAGVMFGQVDAIVASGMITSGLGLCNIPHLNVPVTLEQLAEGSEARFIPEISPLPIWFIPGIKNAVPNVILENCDAMDMMRGEEVEVFGLLKQHAVKDPALIVLPGSHTKLVKLDEQQRITGCVTTMAGEVLDIFTHQTVLTHSLQHGFAQEIDDDYLFQGADTCKKVGITRAAFTVRILDVFTKATDNQRANFLLGAVLYSDIDTMKYSSALNLSADTTIIISGKPILKDALKKLIHHDAFFTGDVITISENKKQPLSGTGALAVLKHIQSMQS